MSGTVSADGLPNWAALDGVLVGVGGVGHLASWADLSMELRVVEPGAA